MKTEIPEFLIEMSEQLNTQNNRITAEPIFQVRCKRLYVTAEGHEDKVQWVDQDSGVICDDDGSIELVEHLTANYEGWVEMFCIENSIEADDFEGYFDANLHDDELPNEIYRCYVAHKEEVVRVCYTEDDANAFIKRKQHDYPPLYIYVETMNFCPQMIELRKWIMSLTESATA